MKMGYKTYSYDNLPREVKDKLSSHPDICGENSFHKGQHYKTPHVEKYLKANNVKIISQHLPLLTMLSNNNKL